MAVSRTSQVEQTRIMLGVLEAADGPGVSQRRLAADLGIALGLVNAYIKRCVRKGLLKVSQVPARRYGYYLTPEGFVEKSRLTAEYLSQSLSFFREARADCAAVMARARAAGWQRLVFAGVSDVTEIAALCAMEAGLDLAYIVDPASDRDRFLGRPIVADYAGLAAAAEAVVVTAIVDIEVKTGEAVAAFGTERVLLPRLLAARLKPAELADE